MQFRSLRLRKTAGIRVTHAVHASIRQGDSARSERDWAGAITAYRTALASAPDLSHIWVQLGHMLKEAGEFDAAAGAYDQAIERAPHSADAYIQQGFMAKDRGQTARAVAQFSEAARCDPANPVPLEQLRRLVDIAWDGGSEARADIRSVLSDPLDFDDTREPPRVGADGVSAFYMDCSRLVLAFLRNESVNASMQRQIKLISATLGAFPDRARLLMVHPDTLNLIALNDAVYQRIARRLLEGNTPSIGDRAHESARFFLASSMRDPLILARDSWLIGFGACIGLTDETLVTRSAKSRDGVRYMAIVDDLLPIALPQFSADDGRRAAMRWLVALLRYADTILAASSEIRDSLSRLAVESGIDDASDRIEIASLDAASLPRKTGEQRSVDRVKHVLVAGTIGGSSGHLIVLDAWLELIQSLGDGLPELVFLGNASDERNEVVMHRIRSSRLLSGNVRLAEYAHVDDLARLYDEASVVICPSLYEGSAAILADARIRGVPTIASDLPALREAGDGVTFFPAGDAKALKRAIEHQLSSATNESMVSTRSVSWEDVAGAIIAACGRASMKERRDNAPVAIAGRWHGFTPSNSSRLDMLKSEQLIGSGADFRSDDGWLSPSSLGCWTRPQGGEITIDLPSAGVWRISLQLIGHPTHGTGWSLDIEGRDTLSGNIGAGNESWVLVDDLCISDTKRIQIRLFLKGLTSEIIDLPDEFNRRPWLRGSLGVKGFHICLRDDWESRERLVETVALSDLSTLSAYA